MIYIIPVSTIIAIIIMFTILTNMIMFTIITDIILFTIIIIIIGSTRGWPSLRTAGSARPSPRAE